MVEPDLAGYREAQIRLVSNLGTTVPFFTPTAEVYAPGTPIDPETDRPFDPTVAPLASGFSSAGVKCGVAIRPVGLSRRGIEDDVAATALGLIEEGTGILIVPRQDYLDNDLDTATEVEVHGERYEITQSEEDGLADETHRFLVYIKQL